MAAGDLTTLATVRGYLPTIDPTDIQFDDLLTRLITAVSTQFTTDSGRVLASATATETYSGLGGQRLTPKRWPITAVTSVYIDGELVPERPAVGEAGWVIDEETSLCFDGYWLTQGLQNVELTYTAGYTVIPADVEQACIKMVCLQFSDRNRIGQNSRAIAGDSVNYADAPVLAYWRSVVDAYRTPRIG